MSNFLTNEKHLSQIPALKQLIGLGYEYLSHEKGTAERVEKTSNVFLEGILRE